MARKIIIVWWWKKGSLRTDVDYWNVENSSDQLIRIDERCSPAAESLIADTIAKHIVDDEILLLLHRNHGYHSQAISSIIGRVEVKTAAKASNLRAFLFGEGEDAVYLSANARGILGSKGSWIAVSGTKKMTALRDEAQCLIKKVNFVDVWQQYKTELKEQIFALKEDLFTTFLPLMSQSSSQDAYSFLRQKENEIILLRLLSFIGRIRPGSRQERQLKEKQEAAKEKWIFGDIKNTLSATYGESIMKHYEVLLRRIKTSLLTTTTNTDWAALRDDFDLLLSEVASNH